MKLSVVIPVYNEGPVIKRTIETLERAVRVPHELLVVYDFDGDDTLPAVQSLMSTYADIQLVKNDRGPGVVNAFRVGFDAAQGESIVVTMGDSSDDPETINAMYAKLEEGFDLVCGSRYMPGGSQIGGPRLKSALSRLAGRSLRILIGIPTHDVTSAFKMYRKNMLENLAIESAGGFEVSMELTVKAYLRGYRIAEVPTTWRDRTGGQSKFQLWKWLPKYLRWYWLALWWCLMRRRKGYVHTSLPV